MYSKTRKLTMSIKAGMKMLYYKTPGDKKSEEVVEIVSVQSEAEGGGVTIYIPSLKRERDTEISRLTPIVEKKATLENFFGKPKLELPKHTNLLIPGTETSLKDILVQSDMVSRISGKCWNAAQGHQHGPFGSYGPFGCYYINDSVIASTSDLYAETDNLHQADEVLLDNQRLLFNQLNSLKESLKVLTQKEKKPVADESLAFMAEIAELRTMNTRLLMNQQEMVKEMRQMKAELLELRQARSIPEAVAVEVNPLFTFGTKF
jgi:hypothetical protein